jgi:ankyrin repeat protein
VFDESLLSIEDVHLGEFWHRTDMPYFDGILIASSSIFHIASAFGLLSVLEGAQEQYEVRARLRTHGLPRPDLKDYVRLTDGSGHTSLGWTAFHRQLNTIRYWLSHVADLEGIMEDIWAILYQASRDGNVLVVTVLLDAGLQCTWQDWAKYGEVIQIAAAKGFAKTVEYLLSLPGIDIGCRGHCGQTLLHEAAESLSLDCLSVLLRASADVNSKDGQGRVPIHCVLRPDRLHLGLEAAIRHRETRTKMEPIWI